MARPESVASVLAPRRLCLFLCLMLNVLACLLGNTSALKSYDRTLLLEIGLAVNSKFVGLVADNTWPPEILRDNSNKQDGGDSPRRRRRRGRRGGVRLRLRSQPHRAPLPSVLLANVQSLGNKLDDFRARIRFERRIRDCNVFCLTETWLSPDTPDSAIRLSESLTVHRGDRTEASGKSKGGGVCLMSNDKWCAPQNTKVLSRYCSVDLEYLTVLFRPFYLPREVSAVILTAVYIPPHADKSKALSELHDMLSGVQSKHPDGALLVAGDFNRAMLKKVMPNLFQHVTCPTRGERTLDHFYSQFKGGYRAEPLPALGKGDHDAIFMTPRYRQRAAREAIVTKEVKRWSADSEDLLRDALEDVDWAMFQASSEDVNEYTDVVVSFIAMLTDSIVPTVSVKCFPNQKPWVDGTVRAALKARSAAYNSSLASGNKDGYREAQYKLRQTIKLAKRRFRDRVELRMAAGDTRGLWQGLRTITDHRIRAPDMVSADASLADELNIFYARFEAGSAASTVANNSDASSSASLMANINVGLQASLTTGVNNVGSPAGTAASSSAGGGCALTVTENEVRGAFLRVNTRKAAGPDGIPGRVLRSCAAQLAPVFTTIFNLSLAQSVVPSCFKRSTIIPVPKTASPACMNDYRPVALTSVVMKCFERLVKEHICSVLPSSMDPLQFAYRPNRSTDDAISQVLHTTLSHLDSKRGGYARLLFIDFSSAFNTIVPIRLADKLSGLGLSPPLCAWVLDFLTARPQVVRVGGHTSSSLVLNTGAPQGCVLSPLLYSLYTHDCETTSSSNSIIKFADDTVVVGLITSNDERAYRQEVADLALWCQDNHLSLNTSKTKELIVDFGRQQRTHAPLRIDGTDVERVSSFKYLGVDISEDLSWSVHTDRVVKKARQRLYHLRQLRKFRVSPGILRSFYSGAVESILTGSITAWYGNATTLDRNALRRVVRSAERTIGTPLTPLQDLYARRCSSKAMRIIKDIHHPGNGLFQLMRSGKRLRCHKANTERLKRSFFPQAIRSVNALSVDLSLLLSPSPPLSLPPSADLSLPLSLSPPLSLPPSVDLSLLLSPSPPLSLTPSGDLSLPPSVDLSLSLSRSPL